MENLVNFSLGKENVNNVRGYKESDRPIEGHKKLTDVDRLRSGAATNLRKRKLINRDKLRGSAPPESRGEQRPPKKYLNMYRLSIERKRKVCKESSSSSNFVIFVL